MKLGVLVPEFPRQTHSFFWQEAQVLAAMGVDVAWLSTRRPERPADHAWAEVAMRSCEYLGDVDTRILTDLLSTVAIAGPKGSRRLARVLEQCNDLSENYSLRERISVVVAGLRLGGVLRRLRVDHVHVHSCADAAYAMLIAHALTETPYSLTLHNPLAEYGGDQSVKWKHASFAVVITQKLAEEVRRTLVNDAPPRLLVAPMGVDLELFRRTSPRVATGEGEPFKVVSVARLNPAKGFEFLLEAVAQLRGQGAHIELIIAGEDDHYGRGHRAVLEQRIAALKITDCVRLLGAQSQRRVRELLESAHAFVLASPEEPLGVSTMEAMAMELPVVVTSGGGSSELVSPGVDGYVVEPRSTKGIVDALERIGAEPAEAAAYGEAARQTIAARFSSDRSAHAIATGLGLQLDRNSSAAS